MKKNDTSGSAFPLKAQSGYTYGGLTKRELFAGLLLIGILSKGNWANNQARSAVKMADELLEELDKDE